MYVYVVYIYICRKRERERERDEQRERQTPTVKHTEAICVVCEHIHQSVYKHVGIHVYMYLDVSWHRSTPESSILMVFSIINKPFWGSPIYGNPHLHKIIWRLIDPLQTSHCAWLQSEAATCRRSAEHRTEMPRHSTARAPNWVDGIFLFRIHW